MSDLEIPDRAWRALAAPGTGGNINLPNAARIIVAAELRRMLNDEDAWPCRCHRCIRDRADELDPPERTDR